MVTDSVSSGGAEFQGQGGVLSATGEAYIGLMSSAKRRDGEIMPGAGTDGVTTESQEDRDEWGRLRGTCGVTTGSQ